MPRSRAARSARSRAAATWSPSCSTVLTWRASRLEVLGEPGQSRGAGSDRRVVAAGAVERGAQALQALAVVGAPAPAGSWRPGPGRPAAGPSPRAARRTPAGRPGRRARRRRARSAARPRPPRRRGRCAGRPAARRRLLRTGRRRARRTARRPSRPPQRVPPRPRPPRRPPRPRRRGSRHPARLRPVAGCSVLPQTGQSSPSRSTAASSAAMPSSRAWRSRSQCSRASWASVGVVPQLVGGGALADQRARRAARRPARRARATSVAVRAPGSAAIAAWLASRAPSSSARRAGARVEQGGESLRLVVELDDASARGRRWRLPAGRPRPRPWPWSAARRPRRGGRVRRPAGRRARATGPPRPRPSRCRSRAAPRRAGRRSPTATARACSSSTWSRATSATSGSSGATARAAATSTAVAVVQRRCLGQLRQPGLQAGPPGVCLGDQRGAPPARRSPPRAGRWRRRCHLSGGRPRGAGLLEQCGDPARRTGRGPGPRARPGRLPRRHAGQHLRSRWSTSSSARAVSCRRATSQRSTAANRPVSNRLSSSSRRFSASARRNSANWPWGSSTTWQNCARVSPSRPPTRWPVSSSRVDSVVQPAVRVLLEVHPWPARSWCRTPRSFGRSHCGERVSRSRRPRRVDLEDDLGRDAVAGVVAAQRRGCRRGRRAPGRRGRSRPRRGCSSCRRRWRR